VAPLQDGWEIVAVADGAGSAKYSRQGSNIATGFITECFNDAETLEALNSSVIAYYTGVPADTAVEQNNTDTLTNDNKLKHKSAIINILYKEVRNLHAQLIDFSRQEEINLKDLNTTLIFALCKKFDSGYVVLTFGVGDCPINILYEEGRKVTLLNTLDIGEFGGGTRFITMPEIFSDSNMGNRFSINRFEGFSKLFLMTDGIYDPKFVTENKLEDIDTWRNFLNDLNGENEDGVKVDFEKDTDIEKQLLQWLDFWSKGNHDDRTLAIIY